MENAQIAPVQDTAFRAWREGYGRGNGLIVVASTAVVLFVIVVGMMLQPFTFGWLSGWLIVITALLLGALIIVLSTAPTVRKVRELQDKPLDEIEDPVRDHLDYLGYHYRGLRNGLAPMGLLALAAWTSLVGFGPFFVPGLILVLILATLLVALSHSQEKKVTRLEGSIADTQGLIGMYAQARRTLSGRNVIGFLFFGLLAGALLWSGKYDEAILPAMGLGFLGPIGWWDNHRIKQEESLLQSSNSRSRGS